MYYFIYIIDFNESTFHRFKKFMNAYYYFALKTYCKVY